MPNAYPSLPQWKGTKFTPRFGMRMRIATNGSLRLIDQYGGIKCDLQVYHGLLTQAQRNTLVAFYSANRALTIYFTAVEDGVQRTMTFGEHAYDIENVGGLLYKATVNLFEV